MPAERRHGMDHEHYAWSPISTRRVLRWPDGARIALCVVISLDHMEWEPPEGSYQSPTLAGGLGSARGYPDYPRLTHRDYGHRVGIFRVFDVLEKHGIPPTVAMDALTAEHYPELVRHCQARGCEIIGHGMSVSRMITSEMTEQASATIFIAQLKPSPVPPALLRPGGWGRSMASPPARRNSWRKRVF
ncbi:MAG: hypothetical protein ETSY2_26155, partial [Candidatus Entotheonella gemina]